MRHWPDFHKVWSTHTPAADHTAFKLRILKIRGHFWSLDPCLSLLLPPSPATPAPLHPFLPTPHPFPMAFSFCWHWDQLQLGTRQSSSPLQTFSGDALSPAEPFTREHSDGHGHPLHGGIQRLRAGLPPAPQKQRGESASEGTLAGRVTGGHPNSQRLQPAGFLACTKRGGLLGHLWCPLLPRSSVAGFFLAWHSHPSVTVTVICVPSCRCKAL